MTREALVLEAAREGDVAALAELERRCHTHPWSARLFEQTLANDRARVLLLRAPWPPGAVQGSRILAYCVIEDVLDEVHVHNLGVHPEHRRAGLGRRLLRLALGIAARHGARSAFLEVRQSNWAAIRLYREAGFEAIGTRRGYYSDPGEDALLLRRVGLAWDEPRQALSEGNRTEP